MIMLKYVPVNGASIVSKTGLELFGIISAASQEGGLNEFSECLLFLIWSNYRIFNLSQLEYTVELFSN